MKQTKTKKEQIKCTLKNDPIFFSLLLEGILSQSQTRIIVSHEGRAHCTCEYWLLAAALGNLTIPTQLTLDSSKSFTSQPRQNNRLYNCKGISQISDIIWSFEFSNGILKSNLPMDLRRQRH